MLLPGSLAPGSLLLQSLVGLLKAPGDSEKFLVLGRQSLSQGRFELFSELPRAKLVPITL